MHVYIHIGIGKTGTSSIQSTLYHNRGPLLGQGILYPETGLQDMGYGIAHFGLCPIGQGKIEAELAQTYEKLREEIKASNPRQLVISTENFTYATREFTSDLKKLLGSEHISIVFYAREQASLIESTFLWWQKAGWNYERNIEAFYDKHKDSFNLLNRIESWVSAFGKEAMICRLYDRRTMGSNVVDDFLSIINTEMDLDNSHSNENQSIPACFSGLVTKFDECQPTSAQRADYIDQLLSLSSEIEIKRKSRLLSEDLLSSIRNFYAESNHEFARQYLSEPERKALLSPLT